MYRSDIQRKFGSYITLNLAYLITLIPGILAVWFSLMYCVSDVIDSAETASAIVSLTTIASILIAVLFSLSPFSSGYFYVLRNFSREDNAWEFSDFFGKFKSNIGKSIATFLIDTFIVCSSFLAIRVYLLLSSYFLLCGLLLVLFLFMLSIPYKWIMIVTFDMKLLPIYKNSFFLLFVDAKRNFLYVLSILFYWFVMFLLSTVSAGLVTVIVLAVIGISSYGLILCINTYPTVKKFLIDSQER